MIFKTRDNNWKKALDICTRLKCVCPTLRVFTRGHNPQSFYCRVLINNVLRGITSSKHFKLLASTEAAVPYDAAAARLLTHGHINTVSRRAPVSAWRRNASHCVATDFCIARLWSVRTWRVFHLANVSDDCVCSPKVEVVNLPEKKSHSGDWVESFTEAFPINIIGRSNRSRVTQTTAVTADMDPMQMNSRASTRHADNHDLGSTLQQQAEALALFLSPSDGQKM